MMVRLYEIGEESAGNVEIGFIFFLIELTLNMTKTEFMVIGSGQRGVFLVAVMFVKR